MTTKILARQVRSHVLSTAQKRRFGCRVNARITLTAEAVLRHIQGNERPCFSVTGAVKENGRTVECGCLHDIVSHFFPDLRPVIALHLSDDTGEPMHAVENALYHAGAPAWASWDTKGDYGPRSDILADHLRIDRATADVLIAGTLARPDLDSRRAYVAAFVESQRPRWAAEAAAALAFLKGGNA
jgi:hypothetical protein